MTNERLLAFAAGKNFKLFILSILQGNINPAELKEELKLPSIADKNLEKKLEALTQSILEIATVCHNQRKINL
jgi:hypothetical protein